MTPHRIVLETAGELATAADALERAGHRTVRTWRLPATPWDLTDAGWFCCATVRTEDEATSALLAAIRGCGVVAAVDPTSELGEDFVADLERVGGVQRRPPTVAPTLPAEERRLLGLLAGGRSIPEAAGLLFISVRTAERRVASARRTLGVATTAEAVRLVGPEGARA